MKVGKHPKEHSKPTIKKVFKFKPLNFCLNLFKSFFKVTGNLLPMINEILKQESENKSMHGGVTMKTFRMTTMKVGWWLKLVLSLGIYLITWSSQKLEIDDHQVTYSIGVFRKSTLSIPLKNIQNVVIKQSFWGRFFHYGEIRIESAGNESIAIDLIDFSRPNEIKNLLLSVKPAPMVPAPT